MWSLHWHNDSSEQILLHSVTANDAVSRSGAAAGCLLGGGGGGQNALLLLLRQPWNAEPALKKVAERGRAIISMDMTDRWADKEKKKKKSWGGAVPGPAWCRPSGR